MKHDPSAVPPLAGTFLGNLRSNGLAGFFVFLIAMPLCLAIARASGFPPLAGIWTAVIGGILTSFLSNSQLTIKGPAAGLIVIVYGSVTELGREFGADLSEADRAYLGYRLTLGIGVAAGVIQVMFGLLRAGRLADFFPLTPVHGMLVSIGLIIISKQLYEVLGVAAPKNPDGSTYGPLGLYAALPGKLSEINPQIAVIGVLSLAILFGIPLLAKRLPVLKKVPSQLLVLIAAIALGSTVMFDLDHQHKYLFPDHMVNGRVEDGEYEVGPKFLVKIPNVLSDASKAFALPDFDGLATTTGLQYLLLFTLIGSLESLLSAKAIELLDPWKRKTNFDRDLLAIGLANILAAAVGGLPMISEIVRSKANIDNGARTRSANAVHGLFLLGFVLLFPGLIHSIPLAALGAMLVYTGFRLASPQEFVRTYRIGSDQFLVLIATIVATLAVDLLVGIGVGIALEIGFLLWHGCPINGLWNAPVTVVAEGDTRSVVVVHRAAVFGNWLGLRMQIELAAIGKDEVTVDLSQTRMVDHSAMEKLHELERDFSERGQILSIRGLDLHTPLSEHPAAARKLPQTPNLPM